MKYKIGDTLIDTDAFGTVEIIDAFLSPTTGQYCYNVKNHKDDVTFLCWEAELTPGQWKVSNE